MGPLAGLKIIELQGEGPGPFCGMMFADMGAEVICIDRAANVGQPPARRADILRRGRKHIGIDLKSPRGVETALRLIDLADVLIEGFRPGVTERLGLGPNVCLERNPRLIYGRVTGWGQTGPMAQAAGHDINYIALSGVLHAIGEDGGKPVPPLNLVGDFGGGGMLLAFGIVTALVERHRSGRGQVVDAAMTDGSALLMNAIFGIMYTGAWGEARGQNLLDGGAHFYNTYETRDGRYISVGAMEPKFYALLLEKSGLTDTDPMPCQMARATWPELKRKLTNIFKTKTREEWDEILLGTDACYAPVLTFAETRHHPHNVARQMFVEVDGIPQAAPAPRFNRTPTDMPGTLPAPGAHTVEILAAAGFSGHEIDVLKYDGAVA